MDILIAYDDSEYTDAALNYLTLAGLPARANVRVLSVLDACHETTSPPSRHYGCSGRATKFGRSARGITTIAFVGAGHTLAQTPHPVHALPLMRGLPALTSMALGTGHRSEQTVQNEPVWARQAIVWIHATPIFRG